MNTTEHRLKRIQDKVQAMLKQQAALQKENETLKQELDQVKKEAMACNEQSQMLRQRMEIIKYSNGEMDEADKKQFEKKISTYIREIDRCIAMLSK